MRILVLNEGKKKVVEKLKLKGFQVKLFTDAPQFDSEVENLQTLEQQLEQKKKELNT